VLALVIDRSDERRARSALGFRDFVERVPEGALKLRSGRQRQGLF
jgi:hypothetical protein